MSPSGPVLCVALPELWPQTPWTSSGLAWWTREEGLCTREHSTVYCRSATSVLFSRREVIPVFPHCAHWFNWLPSLTATSAVFKTANHHLLWYTDDGKVWNSPHIISRKKNPVALMWLHFPENAKTTKRGWKDKNGNLTCLFSLQTWRSEGFMALYKGFFPNWLRLGPWNIIVSLNNFSFSVPTCLHTNNVTQRLFNWSNYCGRCCEYYYVISGAMRFRAFLQWRA